MNRLAKDAQERAAAEGILPLDFLLKVMRDTAEEMARRVDAAKAAVPYLHPKLQPIDGEGNTEQRVAISGALAWKPPQ